MRYLTKTLKVLTLSLVVCVLLFSVFSSQVSATGPFYTFFPIPSIVATVPHITFLSFLPLYTPEPSDTSSLVNFADTKLRDALVAELGVAPNALTENYLGSLTGTLDLSNYGIEKLQGIEALDNLDYLILRNNPISSRHEVKRLKLLSGLESLDISALSITELPSEIGSMSNLKYLDISANRLDKLPSALSNLNLDVLLCNYCYFDIENPNFVSTLVAATSSADYQYQLEKLDFYVICETPGTAIAMWESVSNIQFPNGAVAELQRFSISKPNTSGSQGAWLDSESSSSTSYTFEGLDQTKTYSFDISADYYIKNTAYDGKYIKYYSKELFQPIPQDTPTPKPTITPEPTAQPVITDTPAPVTMSPELTQAPEDIITTVPNTQVGNTSNSNNSMLTLLLVIIVVLVIALIGLVVFLLLRMNSPKPQNNRDNIPPPPKR